MRQPLILCSPLIAVLTATSAYAADWYVSPTGTATAATDCSTRATPCDLTSAGKGAMAGDTVYLMDGVYKSAIFVENSGTTSAWITFKADECATPIIEGQGVGPMEDIQDTGVHSQKGEFLRFEGIIARGWNIGFGNAWAGGTESDEVSNGNWEIKNCISYSNGRTGFTFFSAGNFKLVNAISAHNGSSRVQSWSSGVTLFEASGTNLVQGVISFENTDGERSTDGSGFIVDEASNNATFINNLAFGNSGSCFRLTRSSGTKFINNTCYHNSQFGGAAMSPTNPGEIYFTNGGATVQGVNFRNNVIVGTGQAPAGSQPVQNQPTSGWMNNVVATGSVNFFTAPTGTNPDFTLASGATNLVGAGSTGDGVPSTDVGFDPKCLVKRSPVMVGNVAKLNNWQFDVDVDYIKSIGGVASCFNPAMRSGTPDIGAYKSGTVTTKTAGWCMPPPIPPVGGAGGMPGTGGASGGVGGGTGGTGPAAGGVGTGGAPAAGAGGSPTAGTGGSPTAGAGAAQSSAGTAGNPTSGSGGAPGSAGSGTSSAGTLGTGTAGTPTAIPAGGTPNVPGGAGMPSVAGSSTSAPPAPAADDDSGCGCRMAPRPGFSQSLAALAMLGLGLLGLERRRRSR